MEIIRAESLDGAIAALFGEGARVASRQAVYGGDINHAYRLGLAGGGAVFMKCNAPSKLAMFQAEAAGLEALRNAAAIGVPQALALGTDGTFGAFLLLEHLDSAPAIRDYWETFGRQLAALHRADCAALTGQGRFGFPADNFIGATVQVNRPADSWTAFFRDCRLAPQLAMAAGYFDSRTRERGERMLEQLDRYLPEPDFPSLLHGDLWSGNALRGPDGRAWILDPAAYVGHYEAELAMTELFGGFSPAFYGAYGEINPLDSGYRERRELYDLYHLLNHLNLFGPSYLGSVERILHRYG